MTAPLSFAGAGFTPYQYAVCLGGIAWRETLPFLAPARTFHRRAGPPAGLAFVSPAGFRQTGLSIYPPYGARTYCTRSTSCRG